MISLDITFNGHETNGMYYIQLNMLCYTYYV